MLKGKWNPSPLRQHLLTAVVAVVVVVVAQGYE